MAPNALVNLFMRKSDITDHELRGSSTSLQMPLLRTENMKKSFSYDGAKLWNSLPADLRYSDSLQIFKNGIGAHNFKQTEYYYNINYYNINPHFCPTCKYVNIFFFFVFV